MIIYCFQLFIANVADQQTILLDTILRRPDLAELITDSFTPHCVTPIIFLKIYEQLSINIRTGLTAQVGLLLLSRVTLF